MRATPTESCPPCWLVNRYLSGDLPVACSRTIARARGDSGTGGWRLPKLSAGEPGVDSGQLDCAVCYEIDNAPGQDRKLRSEHSNIDEGRWYLIQHIEPGTASSCASRAKSGRTSTTWVRCGSPASSTFPI